jgi:MinD superfamily P-loop ATPase
MQAHRGGTPMLISSGFRAAIDHDRCRGCAVCVDFCQFHAITINDAKSAKIDPSKCMGCGICANHCARKAISLERDPSLGEPLEIQHLMEISID